ncbi:MULTISPECIES: hypothetical protein [Halorubrum]|jgi:hypothetical protein|uniref:Uncharacterized protein n=2 Tax=Halorubrum TaxID=56688 RepID=A0A7D4CM97_9EURY|nr:MULTISPECIES: hypothetical protein [Halorubrum]TKX86841.1 hypothetical protein EXE43_06260 [Halorubrum sp. SS5]KOX98205.1 hypothetical protein AMR74_04755 [Halorubrum tropicale]QKG93241.1 hypothetical protein HPS36_10330 [Halorubrum salinarum]RLM66991.1 hypothetical protein DVK08_14115 [Halorubrum sp. Atlit-9R]RLM81815.1 hypothetical protein DVK05_07095 [Halorubrum sp. Atlit-8R]
MSDDDSPEAVAEQSAQQAGGLDEIIPEPLLPVWNQVEKVQAFRRTHGSKYVGALELLTALALTGGYVWWLLIYLELL